MKVQILHSRDPEWECAITVFVDGILVPDDQVEVEDIDPGRGYEAADYQERRNDATAKASAPDASDFDRAVAEALAEARFERY